MKETITQKLQAAFQPEKLEVINESHQHIGHSGNTISANDTHNPESHFKVIITSPQLRSLPSLQAHRAIYQVLHLEMLKLHALSIKII